MWTLIAWPLNKCWHFLQLYIQIILLGLIAGLFQLHTQVLIDILQNMVVKDSKKA